MDKKIHLGQQAEYVNRYSPELLHSIPRAQSREALLTGAPLPFTGVDIWTAYEISWLDKKGKPQVAVGTFIFPADSDAIIESKSFKYYLNSFNQTPFDSWLDVKMTLERDLGKAVNARVDAGLKKVDEVERSATIDGVCIDHLEVEVDAYRPDSALLKTGRNRITQQTIYSHLLKSNCPVTGQPDWATVWIKYSGPEITPESVLKYIISYREHQDFHENCVEKIFLDIASRCLPQKLTVYARYTRRGGLDINPFRTNCAEPVPGFTVVRQ